jgi:hypothetical protein
MFNSNALNNMIAVVVVLLALSLVVQSVQTALKKLFKIKSLQIEQSLVHLFYYVLDKDALSSMATMTDKSPFLRMLTRAPHPAERDPAVKALFQGVVDKFRQLGRVTQSGALMLDSISKEDLKKCIQEVIADQAAPAASGTSIKAITQAETASLLAKVDAWYDTVMQSFEERYVRSMKTWALIISAAVVILLNANFFNVYRNIAISDVMRNSILQTQGEISKRLAEKAGSAATQPQDLQAWFDQSRQEILSNAELFSGFGFTNIKPRQVWQWLVRGGGWENVDIWPWLAHGISVLVGLTIMTLLLSVGAPFWQDVLESLFGVKNLLRKRSDTKNVEQLSGQGQPKS